MKCSVCNIENSCVRDKNSICPKCIKKGQNSTLDMSNIIVSGNDVVISELLTYAWHHFKRCSFDVLKKVLLCFYHFNEILEAKMILWRIYHDILPPVVSRQDSSSRTAREAEVIDIITAIRKLDSDELDSPKFVPQNLSRMPTCGPEELDLMSIVDRLSELERKYSNIERESAKTKDSVGTLFDLHYHTKSYAAKTKITEPPFQVKLPDISDINICKPPLQISSSSTPLDLEGDSHTVAFGPPQDQMKCHNKLHETVVQSRVSKFISDNADATSVDSEGFHKGRNEKRRQARQKHNKAVYGTRTDGSLKGAKRTTDLFVFRLEKNTKTEEVHEYLQNKGLEVMDLICVSNENSRFRSFKLTVDFNHSEQVMDGTFWPEGIGCRQFIGRRVTGTLKP